MYVLRHALLLLAIFEFHLFFVFLADLKKEYFSLQISVGSF